MIIRLFKLLTVMVLIFPAVFISCMFMLVLAIFEGVKYVITGEGDAMAAIDRGWGPLDLLMKIDFD